MKPILFRGVNWRREVIKINNYDKKGKCFTSYKDKIFMDVYEQEYGKEGKITILLIKNMTNYLWTDEDFKEFQKLLYPKWEEHL